MISLSGRNRSHVRPRLPSQPHIKTAGYAAGGGRGQSLSAAPGRANGRRIWPARLRSQLLVGIVAPAGTPREIVAPLHAALVRASATGSHGAPVKPRHGARGSTHRSNSAERIKRPATLGKLVKARNQAAVDRFHPLSNERMLNEFELTPRSAHVAQRDDLGRRCIRRVEPFMALRERQQGGHRALIFSGFRDFEAQCRSGT